MRGRTPATMSDFVHAADEETLPDAGWLDDNFVAEDLEPITCALAAPIIGLRDVDSGALYAVPANQVTRIGSDASNSIVLADAWMSRKHCAVLWQGDDLVLTDLGSRDGTF